MTESSSAGHEVIMAGIGGAGVLTAGRLLGIAASAKYRHVLWYPSYSGASRGGPCECAVAFSDEEIYSHLLDEPHALIVFHPTQLLAFEKRVRKGGLVIVEEMGLADRLPRDDVRVVPVPAARTARAMGGGTQGANLILLGVYVALSQSIQGELVEDAIARRFSDKAVVREANLSCFRKGGELAMQCAGTAI